MVNTAATFLSTFSRLKEQGKFTFLWYNHRAGRRGKKFISSKEKRAPINNLQRSGVGKIAYSIPFNYQKLSKEVTSRQAPASHLSKFLTCSITMWAILAKMAEDFLVYWILEFYQAMLWLLHTYAWQFWNIENWKIINKPSILCEMAWQFIVSTKRLLIHA